MASRRTLLERAKSIFKFINDQTEPFPKSKLQEVGLNPTTAEKWVRLIEYIQDQPRIRVTRTKNNTIIEKIENRYLTAIRRRIMDPSLSYKERTASMDDYVAALLTLEKMETGRIKHQDGE
jgi:hypothetical protein